MDDHDPGLKPQHSRDEPNHQKAKRLAFEVDEHPPSSRENDRACQIFCGGDRAPARGMRGNLHEFGGSSHRNVRQHVKHYRSGVEPLRFVHLEPGERGAGPDEKPDGKLRFAALHRAIAIKLAKCVEQRRPIGRDVQ
jgi:hypothetical protein